MLFFFLYPDSKKFKKIKKFFFSQTRAFLSSPRFACRQQTAMSAASLQALPAPLRPTDDDWAKMLAAHVHLGTKNLDNKMVRSCVLSLFRRNTAHVHVARRAAVMGWDMLMPR
jgi:hypothetical protein